MRAARLWSSRPSSWPGTYDGSPGRLRQSGGIGTKLLFQQSGGTNFSLDNVGLWEYLAEPTENNGKAVGNNCRPAHYAAGPPVVGRAATDDIVSCLDTHRADPPNSDAHPEFTKALLESPRFALVPVLSYATGEFTGGEYRAIVGLIPMYLQTTWYTCSNAANDPCWFKPADTDPLDPDDVSGLFNPGEGTAPPLSEKNGAYSQPKKIYLEGITALVLEWDWLTDNAKNELGEVAPLTVTLFE